MRETGYAHFIMDKHYDPKKIEKKWYDIWQKQGAFHSDAARGGEPYCIVIPPPNVTGILHMGHALNNTIQDILVRWQRMTGRNTVWLPGTDHAGIATQNVVERALMKENKSREDLGRDAFVERVWQWKKEYGDTIIRQLKWLGASCDWERERFTMDEGLSDAVAEVFVRLYEKGLIYRGNYIINWCSRCHTALSDEESEHADEDGKLYYIRYEVKPQDTGTSATAGAEYIVVATTRPETLLGDVAVAVNPNDERYGDLSGKTIVLPVLGRKLQVIQDDFVDPEFGTGVVKVTPAHDPNDFEMGMRHGLTPVNVMNGDGTMNDAAGPYAGLDRFECRRKILDDLVGAEHQTVVTKMRALETRASDLEERLFSVDERFVEGHIAPDSYARLKKRYSAELYTLRLKIDTLNDSSVTEQLGFAIDLFSDLNSIYSDLGPKEQHQMLGSIFPEKLVFENQRVRTLEPNPIIGLLRGKMAGNRKSRPIRTDRLPIGLPG